MSPYKFVSSYTCPESLVGVWALTPGLQNKILALKNTIIYASRIITYKSKSMYIYLYTYT